MNLIQGETVTVIRTKKVLDELGEPTYGEDAREEVGNVVVAPGATADLDASRPEGVTVAYTLCFPKTYAGELKGCAVEVRRPAALHGGEHAGSMESNRGGDPHRWLNAA